MLICKNKILKIYLPCNQWYCLTKLLVLFGNYTCQKTTVTSLKYGQGKKKAAKPRLIYSVCKGVATAAKSLQSCPTLCDPIDAAHQAPLSLGFSRQEHWSGLPFPSPMHESESEIVQLCPTLRDPMDWSPPGSSVHGIFQARVLEWDASAFCGM